jgi:hypothetical protein
MVCVQVYRRYTIYPLKTCATEQLRLELLTIDIGFGNLVWGLQLGYKALP